MDSLIIFSHLTSFFCKIFDKIIKKRLDDFIFLGYSYVAISKSGYGGTGRRNGLKIRWRQLRASSILAIRTNKKGRQFADLFLFQRI